MDISFVRSLLLVVGSLVAFAAVGALVIRSLIWLLERHLDPSLPIRRQEAARVHAIEMTLRAIREGLIKIPGVYRRTVR